MRTGGLEGQGILGQSDEDESWGIRQAISQIIRDDDEKAAAAAPTAEAEAPRKKSFAEVAAAADGKASTSSSHNLNDPSVGTLDQAPRKASVSYADKVKSGAPQTEVYPETRRKSVHHERENEDYFLEDDSGDDADDDNDGDDDDDDENVDDGSRHTHHATITTTGKDTHGHHARVHPHDAPHTGTKAQSAAGRRSSSTREAGRKIEEYTIDQHGNKIPVADVRRDSGFDLLV